MRTLPAFFLLFLFAAACGDRDERYESWSGLSGPEVVGKHIVYLDWSFEEAVVLTPKAGDKTPAFERVPLAPGSLPMGRLEAEKALVFQARDSGLLQLFRPEEGSVEEFPLEAPYDRFVFREDPPLAAAWFSANAAGSEESLFLNQGEVAFVDLADPAADIYKRVLKTYGGAPFGLDLADPVPTPGGSRMFAFVRWNSYLSLVDVRDPAFEPKSIPLKAPDSEVQVYPGAMQFEARDNHLSAYFLAQASTDLYAIDLAVDQLTGGASGISVNVFPTAPGASTFTTYAREDGDVGLIVLCPSSMMVAVLHPATSEVKLYPLEGLVPTALNVFTMVSPDTGVEEQFAFIYNASGNAKTYYYVELHRLAEKKSQAFHRYTTLPAGVRKVYMRGEDTFLVMHSSGTSPISEVSVADGSVVSVGGNITVSKEFFSPDGETMYALATKGSKTYVVAFDVQTLQARKLDVTSVAPASLQHLPDAGLLVLASSNGLQLAVVPDDFENGESAEAVQFLVPHLYGLAE